MKSKDGNHQEIINDTVLRALIGNDDEAISLVYVAFLESGQSILDEVSLAMAEHNWQLMLDAVHKLKSSALSVGANGVGDSAINIESLLKSDRSIREITNAVSLLKEQFSLVEIYIRKEFVVTRE